MKVPKPSNGEEDSGETRRTNHNCQSLWSEYLRNRNKPALRTEWRTSRDMDLAGWALWSYNSGRRFGAGLKLFMIPMGERIDKKKMIRPRGFQWPRQLHFPQGTAPVTLQGPPAQVSCEWSNISDLDEPCMTHYLCPSFCMRFSTTDCLSHQASSQRERKYRSSRSEPEPLRLRPYDRASPIRKEARS